jgi:hypothetical protein
MLSESTFKLVSDNNNSKKRKIDSDEVLEFTALTIESAQLWVEAISAVIHNLMLDPLQGVVSNDKIIERYRYDLLQVIIQFTGPFELRFPKILREYIGNYLIHGELKNNI